MCIIKWKVCIPGQSVWGDRGGTGLQVQRQDWQTDSSLSQRILPFCLRIWGLCDLPTGTYTYMVIVLKMCWFFHFPGSSWGVCVYFSPCFDTSYDSCCFEHPQLYSARILMRTAQTTHLHTPQDMILATSFLWNVNIVALRQVPPIVA